MVTPLQLKIYKFIQLFIEEKGFSPSLSEIAKGIGISPNSISLVSRSIHVLVDTGYLKFHKKGYRNIILEEAIPKNLSLPVVGCIAAGNPIEALEEREMLDLAPLLLNTNHFVLKIKGDSMLGEGILDGDFAICKQIQQAQEGDIVVALIDQQDATLKRISYRIKDRVTLIPANPALKPKAYLPNRVRIQGVLVGLLRLRQ